MASKAVTDRQKSAEEILALGEAQAGAIREALAARLGPHLDAGEALPDVGLLVTLLGRAFAAERDAMVEADRAHVAELRDDAPAREARDEAADTLLARLVELREVITGVYGSRAASAVLGGKSPRDALGLERKAGEVADALRSTTLPPPRLRGAHLDAEAIAEELREMAATITEARAKVATEAREAQATLIAKNEAIEAHDRGFGGSAKALEGLLLLAGKEALAARVRPSRSRPGRREEEILGGRGGDDESEGESAEAGPDGGEGDAAPEVSSGAG